MYLTIFEHVQWRWTLNDRLALGSPRRMVTPSTAGPPTWGDNSRSASGADDRSSRMEGHTPSYGIPVDRM